MIEVILLTFLIVGSLVIFMWGPKRKNYILGAVMSAMALAFLILYVAPEHLGVGRVPGISEQLIERLGRDRIYEVLSFTKDHGDLIILVRESDDPQVFALRIKGPVPPPEHFVLVGGKPIAIAR